MKWSHIVLFVLAVAASTGRYVWSPFPPGSENPVVALMALDAPMLLWLMHGWYAAMLGVITFIGGTLVLGVWRVWFESTPRKKRGKGELPPWPITASDEKPAIVVGETHHPVEAREVPNPDWLVIPERGLYTGVAIFGAVGSGKTSACMHPFARQLFGWQARNPKRRAAGLVLEVKGDFCYDIREILKEAGREDDYMELSLDGKWQWNPLAAHWLDAYSLAYTVSSLLNQLFGKGKDPFWQQAYTNLVKWIIELHRIFPDRWVTLRDVYQCAINPDLFKEKIDEAGVVVYVQLHGEVVISDKDWKAHKDALLAFGSWNELEDGECKASKTPALKEWLQTEGIPYRVTVPKSHTKPERLLARWQSVKTWYEHDWMKLDPKLRTSCVEGISGFLSLFDMEDVADIFCPQAPPVEDAAERPQWEPTESGGIWKHLPPLDELIESGKVLALNMPAGSNPALARAVGVFLKNAWLQTLLRRPARMKADTKRYFRPAVFICDEYQSFASVGEDDPSGDEKAFALTRQCRVIPIVATQSISSLRSVLGTSEAWRALLQTLRTRIFLSLSDDASAELASKLCGQVAKIKPSWTVTESTRHAEVSLLSGKAGGGQGSVGTSKSFREQREALFQPREFALLPNCQAICLPYDGTHATSAVRVYLKPVLPSGDAALLARGREGEDMSAADREGRGMDYLRPFLPGLESVLEDADVSEIMINGPGNVWVESRGEIREHPAPGLDEAALERAAIQIARPLGLDPATAPILDARLDDGSRVAICVPPAAPHVAITIRRFGKRSYSPEDLVRFGSLPQEVLDEARAALLGRRNILVSGGTGSGKTTLLNALVELLPADDRIVSIEDTLELRIDRRNCVRFEARGIDGASVTIRDLVRHALRHRPDHIVVGEVRGGEAADLLQALNTGHGGSLTTIHANNAESALSRLATCAMQGETDLPWEVTCRGVVDGISMVIHMTRREGQRYVEEALHVGDYDAAKRRWHYRPVAFADPQLKLAQVRWCPTTRPGR